MCRDVGARILRRAGKCRVSSGATEVPRWFCGRVAAAGPRGEERRAAVANDVGELTGRIRLGEDSALELKRVMLAGSRVDGPSRHDFADELAAFANTRGGTVVLGVDDRTREIEGIRSLVWARSKAGSEKSAMIPSSPRCTPTSTRRSWKVRTVESFRSFASKSPAACSYMRAPAGTTAGSAARSAR